MSLPGVIQGSLRPSLQLTWLRKDTTTPEDLSDATISGTLRLRHSTELRAIAGALHVTDGPNGVFQWDLDALDVATPGLYAVEFTATYASGPTPGKTFESTWRVSASPSS